MDPPTSVAISLSVNVIPTVFVENDCQTNCVKLIIAFNELIKRGHSVLVIEHNSDVLKCADWIIDIGPGGGKHGGNVLFEGTPEEMIVCKESFTGEFLKEKLEV